jgi:hypothetical protein
VGLAINAAFTVFIFGAIVDAYYQLREDKPTAAA